MLGNMLDDELPPSTNPDLRRQFGIEPPTLRRGVCDQGLPDYPLIQFPNGSIATAQGFDLKHPSNSDLRIVSHANDTPLSRALTILFAQIRRQSCRDIDMTSGNNPNDDNNSPPAAGMIRVK